MKKIILNIIALVITTGLFPLIANEVNVADTDSVSVTVPASDTDNTDSVPVTVVPVPVTPQTLPIGSVAEAVSYAWESMRYISMNAWTKSTINTTTSKPSVWLEYQGRGGFVDIQEVLGTISGQHLYLSTLYSNDTASVQLSLYDTNGQNLFYGGTSSVLPENGQAVVVNVQLDVNPEINVPFPGAQWYYIVERDEAGNAVRYYYPHGSQQRNGNINFPLYFAGKLGEMVVTMQDGTQVAYSLNGGRRIVPNNLEVAVNVTTVGMRVVNDSSQLSVVTTEDEYSMGINPLIQYTTPSARTLTCKAMTSSGEYATSVKFWRQGSSHGYTYFTSRPDHLILIHMPDGRYWAQFNYPSGYGNKDYRFNNPPHDPVVGLGGASEAP